MKIGRGLSPNQRLNYDIQFPLMVTWANRLEGMTQLTTMREVRKQLNYLTSKEVDLVHFKFSVISILALCNLIYPMLHA